MYWVPEKKYSMNAFLKTVEANLSNLQLFFKVLYDPTQFLSSFLPIT